MKDLEWFKNIISPKLDGFELQYKFFENGDFGSLNQIEFNSNKMGGIVDFWSSGWLGIHLVDYINGIELMNFFLEPEREGEKDNALEELHIS